MSLNTQTTALREKFYANGPQPVVQTIKDSISEVKAAYDANKTIQVGDTLPEFNLTDALGKPVSSTALLAKGPILINFYRGQWCPFCSLQLQYLQRHLAEFEAKGVTLVAISPELPDRALSVTEKEELKFRVLSDEGNKFARQLGIVWKMPENMRPVFAALGHDLPKWNGDDSFEIPMPTVLLVDAKGIVRNTFIEPDYTVRFEPTTALKWIDEL